MNRTLAPVRNQSPRGIFPLGPADLDDSAAVAALREALDDLHRAARREAEGRGTADDRETADRKARVALRRLRHAPAKALADDGDGPRLVRRSLPAVVVHRGAAFSFDAAGRVRIHDHNGVINLDSAD